MKFLKLEKNKLGIQILAALTMFVLMVFVSSDAFADLNLDATKVNASTKSVSEFIVSLLNGWAGYLLSLCAFVFGIFAYFKDKDLLKTFAAFGMALAIIIVPPLLEGFFKGINP